MFDKAAYLKDLGEIVAIDSGSYNRDGVNQVGAWFQKRFDRLGYFSKAYDPDPSIGIGWVFAKEESTRYDVLVLCHMDTVFPKGEAAKRPFKVDGEKATGPGVADMKMGCLFALYCAEEIEKASLKTGKIAYLFNPEEEISSTHIRPVIEDYIKKSRMVACAEPVRANGAYVKQRKGAMRFTFDFHGVAAHSGNNPKDGACAVTELAHWVLALKELENDDRGITVNTGIISGGTSVNSVPDVAQLKVDIRMQELEDATELEKKIQAMQPFDKRVKVIITGGTTRPPMVPDKNTEKMMAVVDRLCEERGIEPKWTFSGGGSDASFASAMGVPALCGLSGRGTGFHTEDEAIFLDDLDQRYGIFRDMLKAFSELKFD